MQNKTWPTKKLGELADVRMGETLIKKDLTGDGTPIFSAGTDIKPWGFTKKNKLTFGKNSIVLSARGTIGEPRLPLLEKFTATQTTIVVTNKSESILNTVFLWRFLQTFNFNTLKNQAAIPMMTVSDVNRIEIPLPPLKIQKQIVTRIEKFFEKINKAKELREKSQEETGVIFSSASQEIFSKVEKKYSKKEIQDFAIVKGGKRLPKGARFSDTKTEYPYIRVVDFKDFSVDTLNLKYIPKETHQKISRYIISKDDVYISIAGTIGLVGTIPNILSEANLTENAAKIVFKDKRIIDKKYLVYYLASSYGKIEIDKRTNKVGQPKLALMRIETIQIPLPSLSEQKKIVAELDALREKADTLKQLQQKQLEELTELKQSILSKAFKGELIK